MKILRIITRMNVGGPSLQVNLLARAFQDEKYQTHVIKGQLLPGEGDFGTLLEGWNGEVTDMPELVQPLSPMQDFKAISTIKKVIRQFKPDIVHTHHAKAGLVGRIAAWQCKVPVRIHTFHGNIFSGHFHPAKAKLFRWLERRLTGLSTKIVAISPRQAEDLEKKHKVAPASKITTIPLGFDLTAFEHATDEKAQAVYNQLGCSSDDELILMAGRFTHVKNHEFCLRAIAPLLKEKSQRKLILVGEGEKEASIRAQAESLGITSSVIFAGESRDMPSFYKAATLTVITSHSEGTPAVLIESLATGTPFVASKVGGIPDLAGDGAYGLCYTPDDAADFRQHLQQLLDDPSKRTAMGKAGQAFALATHSEHVLVENIRKLYQELTHA